jgi:hypothetical protein
VHTGGVRFGMTRQAQLYAETLLLLDAHQQQRDVYLEKACDRNFSCEYRSMHQLMADTLTPFLEDLEVVLAEFDAKASPAPAAASLNN